MAQHSVLFVCLGNICRSPMAEIVMRSLVQTRGVASNWTIDSAGTAAYHVGDEPDSRTVKVCRKNLGTSMPNIDDIRGRQVHRSDFDKFELVLCMDKSNLHDLHSIRPAGSKAEVRLLGSFDPQGESIIEDPYYGGIDGFQHNFQQVMRCCNEILDQYQ